jgi:hypothetical protein
MAGVVETTHTFATNEVITSTLMNNIIDETLFTADAITGTTLALTSGKLKVATTGITSNEMAANAITTTAILDANVTPAKLSNSDFGDFTVASGVATLDSNVVTTAKINNGAVTFAKMTFPTNFPIQTTQVAKTDPQTITGTASAFNDITGLSLTLTRANASASGKVRIQAVVSTSSNDSNHGVILRIVRGSTPIGLADTAGTRIKATSNAGYPGEHGNAAGVIDFIDSSPGSSATVTYKIQAKTYSLVTGYINQTKQDDNSSDYGARTISTLTLTELAP